MSLTTSSTNDDDEKIVIMRKIFDDTLMIGEGVLWLIINKIFDI